MEEQDRTMPFPPSVDNALSSLPGHRATQSSSSSHIPMTVPQSAYANPMIQPSSVINLSNSSDVVIGPMTQYQGPVTIYQYMDATVETRAMSAGAGISQNRSSQKTSVLQKLSTTSKLLILLILVIVLVVGVFVYIELDKTRQNSSPSSSQEIIFGNNYETGTFPNLGNGHLVIDREQWGAAEQAKNLTIGLENPVPYVLLTHVGVQSNPCFNVYKCSIKMRTLQDSSIAEKGLPDIASNFYVGNDGNVYVGRGWKFANTYMNKTLAVTFMGDYIRHQPDEKQLEAVQYLLSYGMTNRHIAVDYKLVAHNQTKKTSSPGTNVYKKIVTWPHWYPCGMDDNPKCGVELGLPAVWDGSM